MQCKVLCLRWEVGSVGSQVVRLIYGGGTGVCLLSSFLLLRTKYVRYLMAFWWMSFISFLMLGLGIFMSVSFWMECSWMAPRTPPVIVMMELVFHPLLWIAWFSGSYLVCFRAMACSGNLSWQYVNSINCTVWLGDGDIGSVIWFGAPIMHKMSSLSLAWHWQGVWEHVHCNSHSGTVCSCGWLLILPAFTLVKNRVCLFASSVWVIRWTALLCRAILSPFRWFGFLVFGHFSKSG